MDYLNKIKQLSKINITSICKEMNINRSNLLNGKSTTANEKKVYDAIIKKYESIKEK